MTLPINERTRIPPGFRFHPTDEELVNYYLKKKVALEKFELDVILDVDLNKLEPWDLHERCNLDSTPQTEWYFFCQRDKKYPSGTRTNRATAAGFWKATGRDKAVYSKSKCIGMRKTLVFYTGRAPHGQKTEWIMHEYRLEATETGPGWNEDSWVVCRVFKKRSHELKESQESHPAGLVEEVGNSPKLEFSKHSQIESTQNQPFICKEEFGFDEYGLPRVPFLQLPQLKSRKMNYNPLCLNAIPDLKRVLAVDQNWKRLEFPSPFSLDITATTGPSSLLISEDSLTEYANDARLAEWSTLESISKELKLNPDMNNAFLVDNIQYPEHRQTVIEYSTTGDAELWNFSL